ncbi:spore cortex-lytic enzyme [Paenibacillus aquistagni]|uniref:Spore cortex-lytic enzyme n=1 Tax=Paenibacillus aquistagni TaxID=1852522 RepID=A0A1X7IPP3_9BACL|nr:spore cortex-lytic enzyme [Paenibacillus aquistagni]SMG17013.1 N-acetylmuramoyl-L-alanine amidase [Paenibacillus aquistagni]
MRKRKRVIWIAACLVAILFGAYQLKYIPQAVETFGNVNLKVGSTGQDVRELQGRMKFLGFFYGDIDGIFGSKTSNSLKWFQSEFGLKVDGIAGPKTKLKLYNATKKWKPGANTGSSSGTGSGSSSGSSGSNNSNVGSSNNKGFSENDIKLMANAVYGESRGEPYEGQVAVAAVILNRVKSPSFPNTVSGVIFQPGAFTAVADGQIYLTPNETAKRAVQDAINGWDPSGGCLYYFNPKTATSKWIWSRPQVKTIGQHIFCM